MSKVAVFIADGLEEIEGLTVVDILRRLNITTDMISVMGSNDITGAHNISFKADMLFEDAKLDEYDMYVLPGGGPGTKYLKQYKPLHDLLLKKSSEGKYICAICAAPTVLGVLQLLNGKRACCYEGLEDGLEGAIVTKDEVTVDGRIITSRGMGTAIPFALALGAALVGDEETEKLRKGILYK